MARLIVNDVSPIVYKVSLGSFDTHANQLVRHESLLDQLAVGLSVFRRVLKQAGKWDDTLVMTYSEFGRRATENASAGTDHGTAAPVLLLGGRVNGGLLGRQPSLRDLENGDLRFAVDFRSVYNSVARQWLRREPAGSRFAQFEQLPLVRPG